MHTESYFEHMTGSIKCGRFLVHLDDYQLFKDPGTNSFI